MRDAMRLPLSLQTSWILLYMMVHERVITFRSKRSMDSILISSYFFRQRLILIFVFSFIFGVLVSSFIFVSPLVCVLAIMVAGAVYLSERILHGSVNRDVIVLVLIIFLSLLVHFGITLRTSIK
jgi:hypothetical protein